MALTLSNLKSKDYCLPVNDYLGHKNLGVEHLLNVWTESLVKPETEYVSKGTINLRKVENMIARKKRVSKPMAYYGGGVEHKFIQISVADSFYMLPYELKEIYEEINFSKSILDYKNNWDGENSLAIPQEVYKATIDFLIKYSIFILNNTGIVINSPEINPGRNGDMFLSWRTEKARLAINIEIIKNEGFIANFYGDLRLEKEPIKGNVSLGKVSEFLAYWMKNLT